MDNSVLVIENDAALVRLLTLVFEQRGFTVYAAYDGVEGVKLALLRRPAVIILDIMLPEMHGFDVLQEIRSHPELARAVVIVASAKSFKADINRAKELGATDYLVKPFTTDELVAVVERHRAKLSTP